MIRRVAMLGWGCIVASTACSDEELVDGIFTAAQWAKIEELSPLPDPPLDSTNRFQRDPMAAALGQALFFETDYAGPLRVGDDGQNGGLGMVGDTGKIACASCHQGPWLIDLRTNPHNVSLGADIIARNAASMVNVAYYAPWIENDGLLDSLWSEAMIDIESDTGFNSSRLRLAHVIHAEYREQYDAIFDPDLDPALDPSHPEAARFPADGRPTSPEWNAMTPADQEHVTGIYVNFGKALHAYLDLLVSRDAPFDRYVAGETDALTPAAKRGLRLFVGRAACVECHDTPHFSDDDFHDTAIAATGPFIASDEQGRYARIDFLLAHEFNSSSRWSDDPETGRLDGLTKDEALIGAWRTKGLRQVAETAPYMHTGQFATLEDVIDFYDQGGHAEGFQGIRDDIIRPLDLSADEKSDLVEFLKTLTGQELPAELLLDPGE